MARRDNQIAAYPDDDLYEEIETRADEAGISKSGYLIQLAEAQIQNEIADEINQQSAVERRLEELVAHAAERVTGTVEGLDSAIFWSGVYVYARWYLVKQDYGPLERKQAIEAGIARMREEADSVGVDVELTDDPTIAEDYSTSEEADDGDWYY